MKLLKTKLTWVIATGMLALGYVVSCTKDNQVIEVPQTFNSSTDLISLKVATAPTIDGTIEAAWNDAPKLEFDGTVPDPGGDLFRSLVGNVYSGTLRSLYDDQHVYILAEWNDPTNSMLRQPWYFDPTTKRWRTESGGITFNPNGTVARKAFGEDKIGFLWNINNSVNGWNSGTCFKSCHTGLPASDGFARHKTNTPNEKIDMWHWKSVRTNGSNQVDDQNQNFNYPNGRASDSSSAGGDKANSQMLNQPGVGSVSVPKYLIPGRTSYFYIFQSEIDNNTAKLVTDVNADGILTLSDGTTVDPNTDAGFQRNGATVGAKAIPGISSSPYIGSRGDISCVGVYTGTGWVLEIKRALNTGDAVNDVDFSSLQDQYFGVGLFDNTSAAHATKANLVLKFKK